MLMLTVTLAIRLLFNARSAVLNYYNYMPKYLWLGLCMGLIALTIGGIAMCSSKSIERLHSVFDQLD